MRRTILRSAQIVCMAGTMFVLEVLGEVPGLEDWLVDASGNVKYMKIWVTHLTHELFAESEERSWSEVSSNRNSKNWEYDAMRTHSWLLAWAICYLDDFGRRSIEKRVR